MFQPVQPVRAYERVIEQIEGALRRGELKAGERLPSERELMRLFQVSRSTVREALRVLESNGMLRSRPGEPQGAELLPLSPELLRRPLNRLASSEEVSLEDLLQFRILLDGATSYLAATLRTDEQLTEMESALEALTASVDAGHAAWSEADVAFHDAIARASGNPLLQVCSDVVRSVAVRMIDETVSSATDSTELMRQWVAVHSRMFGAIRAGDAVRAANQARADLAEQYAGHLEPEKQALLRDWVAFGH